MPVTKPPVTAAGEVGIDAPADVVFAYLSNPVNQSNWAPSFVELLEGPDRPPGLGMRYRGYLLRFGPANFVIDEFEPGRAFRMNTDPRAGRLTHRFQVDPSATGCVVAHEICLWPQPLLSPLAPLLRRRLRGAATELDRRMKLVLDAL